MSTDLLRRAWMARDDMQLAMADGPERKHSFPLTLVLSPLSRRPLKLPDATITTVLDTPLPTSSLRSQIRERGAASVPSVSIVIVTYNNLVFNRLCLESLLANTDYPTYEIIVVDNNSTDGTRDYLRALADAQPHILVVYNERNQGFARANNQGLALAGGEILVLLNNDTIVPPRWLAGIVGHLEDPIIGAVGPVTNRICNEAEIDVPYQTYGELLQFAQDYTQAHAGELFDIRMLAMFCIAMRREVYEQVGSLDERFEMGMLEDDDYSMRVRAAGYRVVCAEDIFVHHFSKASFGELVPTGEYARLLEANQRRWEEKWGIPWTPYQRRVKPEYLRLVDRIRSAVDAVVPPAAVVAVVSKGDDDLLRLEGRQGWHFPQTEEGCYAGYHPAGSGEAIAHLEMLRAKGADFLLLPCTAFWWLDHYAEFGRHLEERYACVVHRADVCRIFDLNPPVDPRQQPEHYQAVHQRFAVQVREIVDSLLPPDATIVVVSQGDDALLDLAGRQVWRLPETEEGHYAEHEPAVVMSTHLETLRGKGADFLVLPSTASSWLQQRPEFMQHLEQQYHVVTCQQYVCSIYALNELTSPYHRLSARAKILLTGQDQNTL
jgi:GT2 family glycosyltransferase